MNSTSSGGRRRPTRPPLDDTAIFSEEEKASAAFRNWELYFLGGSTGWFDEANMQPYVLMKDIFAPLRGTSITASVQT